MANARSATRYDRGMLSPLLAEYYGHSDFFNFGYWDSDTETQKEASENLVRRLLDFIPEKKGTILDVACGLGASTRMLLAYYPPENIVATNLSEAQLARGRENAPGVRFLYMDAVDLQFPDGSFDAVLCVEAAFHFNTRDRFYSEAYRVLRPGGRLVTSDILMPARALRGVPSNAVQTPAELAERMHKVGFEDVQVLDRTRECWGGFRRSISRTPGLMRRAGKATLVEYCWGVLVGLYINTVFASGMKTYVLTSATKPATRLSSPKS